MTNLSGTLSNRNHFKDNDTFLSENSLQESEKADLPLTLNSGSIDC